MSIYATLDPETHVLLDMWLAHEVQQGWAYTSERQVQLEAARDEALCALRDDFRRVQMEADHATAGVGE